MDGSKIKGRARSSSNVRRLIDLKLKIQELNRNCALRRKTQWLDTRVSGKVESRIRHSQILGMLNSSWMVTTARGKPFQALDGEIGIFRPTEIKAFRQVLKFQSLIGF